MPSFHFNVIRPKLKEKKTLKINQKEEWLMTDKINLIMTHEMFRLKYLSRDQDYTLLLARDFGEKVPKQIYLDKTDMSSLVVHVPVSWY